MISSFRGEYAWLSNMASCEVEYLGYKFPSVENAYMYAKHPDEGCWLDFCQTKPPNICKKESKLIKIREDWEEVKKKVMYSLLRQKFSKEPFKTKLKNTGSENIVEGNFWNDKFWGVCLKSNPNEGENFLGRFIMHIRTLNNENTRSNR